MANEDTLRQMEAAQGNWPTPQTGQETVSVSGTAEQFNGGAALSVPDGSDVIIRPLPSNTDTAYIGDSGVSTSTGHAIAPDDPPIRVSVDDVSSLWADVEVGGEGVSWLVVTE